uniref:CHK kinase-like domain-containing protein n=1 Tax=Anopheles culicifacies TaxID=139723 RepID=A0A182M7V6_9DIPT
MSTSSDTQTTVVKQLPPFLNASFLQRILEENLSDKPIRIDTFNAQLATQPGDNYSSDVFSIVVHYNDCKEIRLVAKVIVDDEMLKCFGESLGTFVKEVNTFRQLLPAFSRIVSGSNAANPVQFGARCFHATRDPTDTIVFEDLKALGYRMPDRTRGGLDLAHCELIMRKIGLFHAASMVYVVSDAFDKQFFAERYSHGMARPGDEVHNNPALAMFNKGLDKFLEVSQEWPELKRSIWLKLQALKPDYTRRLLKSLSPEGPNEEVNFRVLNHGDLWTNNMMFRYDDPANDASVRKVIFVDFQLSSYGSPGLDLVYCLHNCPQFEIRETQTKYLLQLYHQSLREGLSAGGYERSRFPTFADVQKEYERHEFIGLVSVVSMLPIILMERTEGVKLTFENLVNAEDAEKIRDIQYQGKLYRKSVISILEHCDAKGLLD